MKKHSKLMVCLVVGLLVLSISALATFSSVNGYSRYKDAVKTLALKADNYTADVTMAVSADGQQILTKSCHYQREGKNQATYSKSTEMDGTPSENWCTILNGTETWCSSSEQDYYYTDSDARTNSTLFGLANDEELDNRMVNFAEIAADTIVGDLKNNFVQTGSDANGDTYSVDISESQVPPLINAGLSLMAYSVNAERGSSSRVAWQDYDAASQAYFEKTTGETLPADFMEQYNKGDDAWYQNNEKLVDHFNEVTGSMSDQYQEVLSQNDDKGVVYVHTDGAYDYYPDEQSYYDAHPEEASASWTLENYVGDDASLKQVSLTFALDKNGNLTANKIDVTFSVAGKDGASHSVVFSADINVKDYGTTKVTPLDVGDRTEYQFNR